jgi:hypothetical protein
MIKKKSAWKAFRHRRMKPRKKTGFPQIQVQTRAGSLNPKLGWMEDHVEGKDIAPDNCASCIFH